MTFMRYNIYKNVFNNEDILRKHRSVLHLMWTSLVKDWLDSGKARWKIKVCDGLHST